VSGANSVLAIVGPGGRRGSNTPGLPFRRIIADVHGQLVSGNHWIYRSIDGSPRKPGCVFQSLFWTLGCPLERYFQRNNGRSKVISSRPQGPRQHWIVQVCQVASSGARLLVFNVSSEDFHQPR